MKTILIISTLLLSLAVNSKVKVMTTTTNLANIVRQIGGEMVDVDSFCKGIQDPHYLEAKPSYTYKLSKADLLISVGAGLEVGWLPLVIRGSRNPKIREGRSRHLVASDLVTLIEKNDTMISRSDGDVHPEGNPHFMLSPIEVVKVAKAIALKLVELDNSNEKLYKKRFKNFKTKMEISLEKWKKGLKKDLKVISYHKTLSYFYKDFEIINVDVLEPKPGIPPTASHILGIISKIKKDKIQKIIIENYFDDTVAKRIKKDLPEVQIEIVPVAVGGKREIQDIFSLYEYLISKIGG